jgi:hypothetical protein
MLLMSIDLRYDAKWERKGKTIEYVRESIQ